MKKITLIVALAVACANASQITSIICSENSNDSCENNDSAITFQKIECNPEEGSCIAIAQCNQNISFTTTFQNISDESDKYFISEFNFSYCKENEKISFNFSCKTESCTEYSNIDFHIPVQYIDDDVVENDSERVDVDKIKGNNNVFVVKVNGAKEYSRPRMVCGISSNGILLSRSIYEIGIRENGPRLEMIKRITPYKVRNFTLANRWKKGLHLDCRMIGDLDDFSLGDRLTDD